MIDLTNSAAKQGALDALNILIKAKNKPIEISGGQGGGGNGPKLAMPKNVNISQDDVQSSSKSGTSGDKTENKAENKAEQGSGSPNEDKESVNGDKASGQNDENPVQNDIGTKSDSGEGDGASSQKIGDGTSAQKTGNGEATDGKAGADSGKFHMSNEEKAAMMDEIRQDKAFADEEAEQKKIDAEDALKKALNGVKAADFSELEDDLYYAIAAQVDRTNNIDSTYDHGGDPVYDDSDFIMPQDEYEERKTKPLLYVFIDQSGSFGQDLVRRAKSIVKVLDDFVQDGKIAEPKYFLFAHEVAPLGSTLSLGANTDGWPKCMKLIQASQDKPFDERCTNVMVLSDDDIEFQTN